MQNVKLQLDAWREAERRRDRLVPGSSEWQDAENAVRDAAKVFHAEVAQASVRYAEDAFQDRRRWSALSADHIRSLLPVSPPASPNPKSWRRSAT